MMMMRMMRMMMMAIITKVLGRSGSLWVLQQNIG